MSTAIRSAADIEEVGWPEPAAADVRMESTRSCWPSSRRKSASWAMTYAATSVLSLLSRPSIRSEKLLANFSTPSRSSVCTTSS